MSTGQSVSLYQRKLLEILVCARGPNGFWRIRRKRREHWLRGPDINAQLLRRLIAVEAYRAFFGETENLADKSFASSSRRQKWE
jgi:hypothetical protein